MAKATDDKDAVEMPEFTDEQLNYLLARAYQHHDDAFASRFGSRFARNDDGIRKVKLNAKQMAMVVDHAQMLGFMFNALGVWDRFPASFIIAMMRGDDPFKDTHDASVRPRPVKEDPLPTEASMSELDQHTI